MSDDDTKHFLRDELWKMLVSEWIGGGGFRNVYTAATDPTKVIKVEETAGSFSNVLEWEVWKAVKDKPQGRWFAPCHFISPNGAVLIQARTEPAAKGEYPKLMPAFFTDFKRSNFGLYRGRLVAHDYGLTTLIDNGLVAGQQRVRWWDTTPKEMSKGWAQ